MKITKDMVGKKVTYKTEDNWWVKVLYVGKAFFFGEAIDGTQGTFYLDNNSKWELVEEKKKYAPALIKNRVNSRWITNSLYESLQEAQEDYSRSLVIWPAPLPNKDGYYEL